MELLSAEDKEMLRELKTVFRDLRFLVSASIEERQARKEKIIEEDFHRDFAAMLKQPADKVEQIVSLFDGMSSDEVNGIMDRVKMRMSPNYFFRYSRVPSASGSSDKS